MAFPAIGTGNLGIPRPSVAKWMFDEVITFNKNNPNSSVKTVNFVLYNKDQATVKVRVLGDDKQTLFASERQLGQNTPHTHPTLFIFF